MENTKLNLTIYGKDVKTTDGKTFPVFSSKINEEYFKIAFTRDCLNSPRVKGVYEITVDLKNLNEVKSTYISDKTGKRGASTLWIKCVDTIRKRTEEELEEENLKRNLERFAKPNANFKSIETDEPLPF